MKYESFNDTESDRTDREAQWSTLKRRAERTVDGLGLHIDPGVVEAVVGLHAYGIKTNASCEGHLDHGIKSPWVGVGIPVSVEERRRHKAARLRGERAVAASLERDWIRRNIEQAEKVIPLLEEFYENRPSSYLRRLIIIPQAGPRLISQGWQFQEAVDASLAKDRLAQYREEMNAFSAFLHERFLAGPRDDGSEGAR